MHMLRDFVTETQWGMDVSPTTEGSFWSHTFKYDIPQAFNNINVVLENLEFIVFVAENEKTIITGTQANITFATPTLHKVTASAGENGTIEPIGETEYEEGESATYTFIPDPDYEVEEVFINDEPQDMAQATEYTFDAIDKDHTIHVTFRLINSIKDANGVAISIAPNPVNDKLYITGSYDKLEIISISGQILATVYNQPNIDVSRFAKGIYFVKVQASGQSCTFKVVK